MLANDGHARTYVIPGWIYRAILRNKINLIDISNYGRIRDILSQDDMVTWAYVNDIYQVRKSKLTHYELLSLFDGLTPEQNKDYNVSIIPQVDTEAVAKTVKERLSDVNNMTGTEPFQIINVNDLVLVILNEGFESKIQTLDDLKSFITQYLKGHYTISSIKDVSHLPLYTLYIELI